MSKRDQDFMRAIDGHVRMYSTLSPQDTHDLLALAWRGARGSENKALKAEIASLRAEVARLTSMVTPKPLDDNAPKDRELIGVERPPFEERTYYRMVEWRESEQRWMTKCGVDWGTKQYIWAICGVDHYLDPLELPGLPYWDGEGIEEGDDGMSDIVDRLRGLADLFEAQQAPHNLVLHVRAAADEIERLRAALESRRTGLRVVMVAASLLDQEDLPDEPSVILCGSIEAIRSLGGLLGDQVDILPARAALNGEEGRT